MTTLDNGFLCHETIHKDIMKRGKRTIVEDILGKLESTYGTFMCEGGDVEDYYYIIKGYIEEFYGDIINK